MLPLLPLSDSLNFLCASIANALRMLFQDEPDEHSPNLFQEERDEKPVVPTSLFQAEPDESDPVAPSLKPSSSSGLHVLRDEPEEGENVCATALFQEELDESDETVSDDSQSGYDADNDRDGIDPGIQQVELNFATLNQFISTQLLQNSSQHVEPPKKRRRYDNRRRAAAAKVRASAKAAPAVCRLPRNSSDICLNHFVESF